MGGSFHASWGSDSVTVGFCVSFILFAPRNSTAIDYWSVLRTFTKMIGEFLRINALVLLKFCSLLIA